MGQHVLKPGGRPAGHAAAGFTLVETMVAMSIGIVVMLANLFLFNTANKNLAVARALTQATNLATSKVAEFKTMTVTQIVAAAPTALPSPNPLSARTGSDTVTVDGTTYSRTWTVSNADLGQNGTPDMVGDIVKIKLDVTWSAANKGRHLSMATFTTGRSE